MQRSRITSTPRSGLRSRVRTSSRSSMILVSTRRDSSSARRSFSSTRTRERRTPTRGGTRGAKPPGPRLLTPALLGLWSGGEGDRRGLLYLELGAAVGGRHHPPFPGLGSDGEVGNRLGALPPGLPPPGRPPRTAC